MTMRESCGEVAICPARSSRFFLISQKVALLLLFLAIAPQLAYSDTVVLDFEGFSDSDFLTTQIPGLTFSNAMVLTASISLNEFDFPPHSGSNVIFDAGGPIGISFASAALT